MEPEKLALLIPIISIIGGIIMIIFMRYYENIERMAMIERGMNPHQERPRRRTNPSVTLRFALLAIGCGLGILFGNGLAGAVHIVEEAAVFSMLLIFGGLGLLASYLIEIRMAKKEAEEEKLSQKYNQPV